MNTSSNPDAAGRRGDRRSDDARPRDARSSGRPDGEPARRSRRGRRTTGEDTRALVLAAARERFATHGYDATTMRAIARDAGVDPALLHYFFGTKDQLFAAALEVPRSPAQIIDEVTRQGSPDDLGERLLRALLEIWDQTGPGAHFLTLVRTAPSHDPAATLLREFITTEVAGRLARALDADQPELRANLTASQMVGLVMLRYVVRVEPLASADHDTLAQAIGPTLQRYLTGPIGPARQPEDQASAGTLAGSGGPS